MTVPTILLPGIFQNGRLQWHPVIESNFQSVSLAARSSREEQLMFERKRLATWGITSYELHHESGKLVFPAASTLFQCIDTGYMVRDMYISSCYCFKTITKQI